MVSAPNVLCIDSGLESPYAPGARLFRNPRRRTCKHGTQGNNSGPENSPPVLPGNKGGDSTPSSSGGGAGNAGYAGTGDAGGTCGGTVEGDRGPLNAKEEWLPLEMRLEFDPAQDCFLVRRLEEGTKLSTKLN
jgi:hypothetical protein